MPFGRKSSSLRADDPFGDFSMTTAKLYPFTRALRDCCYEQRVLLVPWTKAHKATVPFPLGNDKTLLTWRFHRRAV